MLLGFDIGGTKCAVITAEDAGNAIRFLGRKAIPTDLTVPPEAMVDRLIRLADELLPERPEAIGVSCGSPLDPSRGLILSPPNLPGWDCVPITDLLGRHYGVEAKLQNDANACAVAEWKFGAGMGCDNMVFFTFGTGMGAGLILNGKLYAGANGNAGECGHIRLEKLGPTGYGKAGSFEGFCSGGGIAQLGYTLALEQVRKGIRPAYFQKGTEPGAITAKTIAEAAAAGDETALEVYRLCGEMLGRGLAVVVDLLNPERIVLGSIFARAERFLRPAMEAALEREALPQSLACCRIVPAALGEAIGDYAAIAVARM